jgi:TfoX/Sxy family transcriptional regulator of competence genes
MAYDEDLVARIREHVRSRPDVTERKMFGGLTFLIGGNMACGVSRNELMVRTGPLRYEEALTRPEAHLMEFTGRPMKGMISVRAEGLDNGALAEWVEMGVSFAASLPLKPPAATIART